MYFAIPALFMFLGSTCIFIGMAWIESSVHGVLGSTVLLFVIILVIILSRTEPKRNYNGCEWLSFALIVAGLIIILIMRIHWTIQGAKDTGIDLN